MYNTDKIVIVGGGSAGWMSAATLINFFPDKDITLVESPNVPLLGVGESTLGFIKYWVTALGIDEKDFISYTDASIKLSIKFTDFRDVDSGSFHYPFGTPYLESSGSLGFKAWMIKKALMPETPVEDFCNTFWPAMSLIENNRISENKNKEFDDFELRTSSAYHFDAVKFAKWLCDRYCKPRGVKHIQAHVKKFITDENGIKEIVLDDGTIITSDLYIDCTGWKSLLLGETLNEPFKSYSDILPNNKAWATQIPYVDKEKELEPYTNCTALGNGWVWNIPLWSRIGTGYVYSDKYIDKEDALKEFKRYLKSNKMTVQNEERITDDLNFKDITMRIGIHERTWVKNVVAIGLSAGFIEPLESNGLFTVHEFLLHLVNSLQRKKVSRWDIDSYNVCVNEKFDGFAKFVSLHYALSERSDTEYWRDNLKRSIFDPRNVRDRGEDTYTSLILKKHISKTHEVNSGVPCISNGLGYNLISPETVMNYEYYNFMRDTSNSLEKQIEVWDNLKKKWYDNAMKSPKLIDYLQEKYYS